MARFSWLITLIGLLMLPNITLAQKKYALLIGVNQYDHDKLKRLNYAVNDVVEMGEILDKHGYQVTYLTDSKGMKPTKANIEAAINELVKNFASGDTLIIGLAGHGLQYPGTKDCFFCPKDAKPFPDETKTLVSLGSVWSRLEKTYSGTKLVLVDACRDDGTRTATESIPLPPKGVGVLMSCSDGQYAREHESLKHGVFFHQVIEGLNGAAKDGDNDVTWDRLREYVKKAVPKKLNEIYGADSGVRQNPNEMGNLTEVPILVKLGGGLEGIGGPKPGEEKTFEIAKGLKVKFCWIPAGEVQLGSSKEEQDYYTKTITFGTRSALLDDESEAVRGKFKTTGFWLGKFEVTQAQWNAIMSKNPSTYQGENLPVEMVSWDDCQEFIKKCSVSGFKVQLPHENEWEYAYRGGKGNKPTFHWGDDLNGEKANCDGATIPYGTEKKGVYLKRTAEVGSYEKVAPHPWNLCDMTGNVSEWCDNFHVRDKTFKVTRGGSCYDFNWGCRPAISQGSPPHSKNTMFGFRLALMPVAK